MHAKPLEKLVEEWLTDSNDFDEYHPHESLMKVPGLYAKYVTQITSHTAILRIKQYEFAQLKKLKLEYYSGRLNSSEIIKEKGWKPFPALVNKSDIPAYLDADEDLIELKKKMVHNEEAISLCERACKGLSDRTYQIREFMQWVRFQAGDK